MQFYDQPIKSMSYIGLSWLCSYSSVQQHELSARFDAMPTAVQNVRLFMHLCTFMNHMAIWTVHMTRTE